MFGKPLLLKIFNELKGIVDESHLLLLNHINIILYHYTANTTNMHMVYFLYSLCTLHTHAGQYDQQSSETDKTPERDETINGTKSVLGRVHDSYKYDTIKLMHVLDHSCNKYIMHSGFYIEPISLLNHTETS